MKKQSIWVTLARALLLHSNFRRNVMRNKNGVVDVFQLVILVIWLLAIVGYVLNIVKLVQCDFKSPYKAEVIHGVGVITPISIVTGYLNLGK